MGDKEIYKIYKNVKHQIIDRISDFKDLWKNADDNRLFLELVFCLLTPQAKAKNAWEAVGKLVKTRDLYGGDKELISKYLNTVRFKNNKASYIVYARELFFKDGTPMIREDLTGIESIQEKRKWLVKNVKGYGFKEASHFLRNIGFVEELAILDRHILKNLRLLNIIEEIPSTISEAKYYEIEKKMINFSKKIKIPSEHLDLLFWYKENGEIFK